MRSVLITGASKGIGRAAAGLLAARGWRVLAGYRDPADAEALRALAPGIEPVPLDVTDADQRAAAARAAGDRLDAVVNNAGIVIAGPLECIPASALREQFEVNVVGLVALTQALLPALRAARGRIINVSSVNGRIAMPYSAPYAASKFALEAISDAWRVELGRFGIRTVLVEPGAIATPIWETSARRAMRISGEHPSPAQALYGRVYEVLGRVGTPRRAVPPERVARTIARALAAWRPRARYVVGRDARLGLLLQRVLPTRWFDRLLAARRNA